MNDIFLYVCVIYTIFVSVETQISTSPCLDLLKLEHILGEKSHVLKNRSLIICFPWSWLSRVFTFS